MARAKPGVIIRKLKRLPMECPSRDIRLYAIIDYKVMGCTGK